MPATIYLPLGRHPLTPGCAPALYHTIIIGRWPSGGACTLQHRSTGPTPATQQQCRWPCPAPAWVARLPIPSNSSPPRPSSTPCPRDRCDRPQLGLGSADITNREGMTHARGGRHRERSPMARQHRPGDLGCSGEPLGIFLHSAKTARPAVANALRQTHSGFLAQATPEFEPR